ncbi:hypothetical protein OIV83_005905 [Microbotryomycetes sp. JL201]|nr:hypothetical protein OIV83_005905 [Microbotryomycetes sp. JL201]
MSLTRLVQSGASSVGSYGATGLNGDRSLMPTGQGTSTSAARQSNDVAAGATSTVRHRKPNQRVHVNRELATRGRTGWYSFAFLLENKGSVARDHLALERTFLAWLRTSLALASIGIAITQLFRLPSSTTIPPDTANAARALQSQVSQLLNSSAASNVPQLEQILVMLVEQSSQIDILKQQVNDPIKYRHLGKPIGGTFIALALLFLVLGESNCLVSRLAFTLCADCSRAGSSRYFICQSALMLEPQSMFPPSKRSVVFSSVCVGICVLATFVAILVTR